MFIETTSIYHDSEAKTDVTSCPDPGCYTKAITYSATMRQMMNLADISASCKQYIRVRIYYLNFRMKQNVNNLIISNNHSSLIRFRFLSSTT